MAFAFTMKLADKGIPHLLEGKLICEANGNVYEFVATSGLAMHQFKGAWREKGRGCIPPDSALGDSHYTVSTNRLWLPEKIGVEGSFYPIAPFSVTVDGIARGDFGIHFDANVPGSAGCIVIRRQTDWDEFRYLMTVLKSNGEKSVPLKVAYEFVDGGTLAQKAAATKL
jgi:hypothetical protein